MGRPRTKPIKEPTPEELERMSPQLRYYYQTRLSPEAKAKRNDRSLEWYNKNKDDAEFKEKRRAQQREAWAEWRHKLPKSATQEERAFIYQARYREKNKERIAIQQKQLRKSRVFFLDRWRALGCALCEESDPLFIDAHHIDPATKTANVTHMSRYGVEWNKYIDEFKKCSPVCNKCHRKITSGRINPVLTTPDFDYEAVKTQALAWAAEKYPLPPLGESLDKGTVV